MRVRTGAVGGVALLASILTVSGCGYIDVGSSKADAGSEVVVTQENLADQLWEAFCTRKIKCGHTSATDVAACIKESKKAAHSAETARRWGTPEDLVKSIENGDIKFVEAQANRCLKSLANLACSATPPAASVPFEAALSTFPACDAAFAHTVLAHDDECLSTWACPSHYECTAKGKCKGSCTYLTAPDVAPAGTGCLRDGDCGKNEICFFNLSEFAVGEYKGATATDNREATGAPAEAGSVGVCLAANKITGENGGACATQVKTDGSDKEKYESAFVFNPATNFGCTAGTYCRPGTPSSGLYAPKCVALPEYDGSTPQNCAGSACSGDLKCVKSDGADSYCLPSVALGGKCLYNGQCRGYPSVGCYKADGASNATCTQLPSPGGHCLKTENGVGSGCDMLKGYCNGTTNADLCVPYAAVGAACSESIHCSLGEALGDEIFPKTAKCNPTIRVCEDLGLSASACE